METSYTPQYYEAKQLESDIRFLKIAKLIGESSKCLSRKIGSILVRENCIVSEGRNGPPRGTKHCNERKLQFYSNLNESNYKSSIIDVSIENKCPRRIFNYKSGEGLHLCCAQHSEENVINQAARNGISTLGAFLYAYCCLPCSKCMGSIINAGIKEVICLKVRPDYDTYSRVLTEESGILLREIDESEIK